MIDQLRDVLAQQGITHAVLIDDVFDQEPSPTDIDEGSWNIFLDDITDQELAVVQGVSQGADAGEYVRTNARSPQLVEVLWSNRDSSNVITALFSQYVQRQAGGQASLLPLRTLLFDNLALKGGVFGTRQTGNAEDNAQLIFVDLFLGASQDDEVMRKAIARVQGLVSKRDIPPIVVLISSSQRLGDMRDRFRDETGLLGCQFRAISKSELDDDGENAEMLYRLCSAYRQSHTLSAFVNSWKGALENATTAFIQSLRRLDLRDYADLQNLILTAEGELIGDYLLEILGQHFQYHLEADKSLAKSALSLNEMNWSAYPAPHFLPSEEAGHIADGAAFRNANTLDPKSQLQFGDLYFSTKADAIGSAAPSHDFAHGDRVALVPMTAACDLQHGGASRVLLMSGIAKPSNLLLHKKPDPKVTPTVLVAGQSYVITWDLGAPFAWSGPELGQMISTGDLVRVRRFRSIFALQLQQQFSGSLSRVGTMVMPPMQHAVSATISYVGKDTKLHQVMKINAEDRKAVVLVGREESQHIDRLTISPEVVREVRLAVRKVAADRLREKDGEKWSKGIASADLFRMMEDGFQYERKGFKRPFTGTDFDIVNVIGPHADRGKSPIGADGVAKSDAGPMIIDIEIPT